LDGRFILAGRQLQDPQVFSGCHPLGVLLTQGVVGHPEVTAGEQLLAVHIVGEGTRLADQRVDHMPIVDVLLAASRQPRHPLDQLLRVPDFHLVHAHHHLHLLADQATGHRVRVALHLNRTSCTHPDAAQPPTAVLTLQR